MQTARQAMFRVTPTVKKELIRIIDERIRDVHVTKEDFSELKAIVRDIAEVQKRTEIKVEELAEVQNRTELRLGELSDAQNRTELRLGELAGAQIRTEVAVEKLARGLEATRMELGGLSRSVGYSLENEAYRQLPRYLAETHGIEVADRMVRMELDGEEINIFARGRKEGKEIYIVGEAELKLSSVGKLRQLQKKVSLVRKHYGGECVALMITHFARPQILTAAKDKGIIIVQSFEW